jgi:PST family polysaccharide transporter
VTSGEPKRAEQPDSAATVEPPGPSKAELDRSLVSGIAWTGGLRSVTLTVQWVAALLVVRLLTPEDYGLVAMATAYLGLVQMFSEFGLGAAVIQRRSLTGSQIARLGGLSVASSVILAGVSIAASGVVAAFFKEPRVQLVIIVMSVTFVFTGIDVIARALLRRDLQFKRAAWVQASQNIAQAVVSLALAVLGFGYWALVLAAVAGQLVRMVAAVASRPHRISWPSDLASIKSELWFGSHVVVSQFALYVRRFSDIVIVGRVLGGEALGAYNVGWTQANIPVDRVGPIVTGVSSSVLASVQTDPPALRRYIRLFTEGLAFMAFPTTLGMAVIADHFVLFVFGERWTATITPLRILCLVAAMRAITPILSQVLVATDQTKKNMQFAVVAAMVMPIFLLVGSRWGINGVAVAWLVGHPLVLGTVLLRHALAVADMRLVEYASALRPACLASGAMVLSVLLARLLLPPDWPLVARLSLEVVVGALVYGLGVLGAYRSRFQTFLRLLRSHRDPGGDGSASHGLA